MEYDTSTDNPEFSCSDGFSTFSAIDMVTEDMRINCFIDYNLSKIERTGDKIDMQIHFVRPFWTDDQNNQDLPLYPGSVLGAQVRIDLPEEYPRASYTTIHLPNLDINKLSSLIGQSLNVLIPILSLVFVFY